MPDRDSCMLVSLERLDSSPLAQVARGRSRVRAVARCVSGTDVLTRKIRTVEVLTYALGKEHPRANHFLSYAIRLLKPFF